MIPNYIKLTEPNLAVDNGKMLLVKFVEEDGEPKVSNVKMVSQELSDELKELLDIN